MARVRRLDDYIRQLGGAARGRSADVEAIIRRLVEELVQVLREEGSAAAGGGGVDGLREFLVRLERLEERLSRLEERVEEAARRQPQVIDEARLAQAVAKALAPALAAALRQVCQQRAAPGQAARQEDPPWLRAVMERLGESGYLLTVELPPEVARRVDPELLRSRGLLVVPAAGGYLVARREVFDALRRELERLKSVGDEYEAAARLGRLRGLFRVLREEGLIYYRGPGRGWVLQLPGLRGGPG